MQQQDSQSLRKARLWDAFSNDDLGLGCKSERNREHFFLQDFGFWKGQTWLSQSVSQSVCSLGIRWHIHQLFTDCLVCRKKWQICILPHLTPKLPDPIRLSTQFSGVEVCRLSGKQSCVYRMQLIQSQNYYLN